jgi:hypothetical protein
VDDIEEIKKLKARYFRGLDSQDWDLYGGVFAEDILVDTSPAGGEIVRGRGPMVEYVQALKMVQSVHQGHMPEIELTSATTATGVWSLEDYNIWEDGTQHHGWGHYLETYEKVGERWFIKTMKLSYLRTERTLGLPPKVAGKEGTTHLRGATPAKA